MKILQTIVLMLLIYVTLVLAISGIAALISIRKGKENAKRVFKDVFWEFFTELLNPLNWI